jgi:hypothetical protein
LFARSGINKISIFKSIYLENHVSHNEIWSNFCLKNWFTVENRGILGKFALNV